MIDRANHSFDGDTPEMTPYQHAVLQEIADCLPDEGTDMLPNFARMKEILEG